MATSTAILQIKVIADASAAAAGLDKASGSASKFGRGLEKAALPAAAVAVGVGLIGKKAIDAASDLQQSQGAVEAVFGSAAGAVKKYAQAADQSLGLSESAYNQYAALVGTALQNAGMSAQESVGATQKVMARGADLSALYGGTTAEAIEAINAAVSRSEFDPLEKYGASLTMAGVNAELAAKGQDKLTGSALETAKKQVILEQVFKKTSKAQNQFAEESGTAAVEQQKASAAAEDAAASLGTALLPAATAAAKALGKMATWASKNTTTVQILLGVIAGLAATILILNVAYKTGVAVQGIWNAAMALGSKFALGTRIQLIGLTVATYAQAAAQKIAAVSARLMGMAMTFALGPVGLIIIAVVALIAVIVILWKRSTTFRSIVLAVWNAVKVAATAAANAIKAAFTAAWAKISAAARTVGNVVKSVFSAIRSAISSVISFVGRLIGRLKTIKVPGSVKSAIDAVKNAVSNAITTVGNLIAKLKNIKVPGGVTSALNAIKTAADNALDVIKSIVNWLGNIPTPHINWPSPPKWLDKVTGRSVLPAPDVPARRAYMPAPGVAAGRGAFAAASAGAAGMVININGAIDPEGTARAVRRVLAGHDRRMGARIA